MKNINRVLVAIGGTCSIALAGYLAILGFDASTWGWFLAGGVFALFHAS